MADELNPQQKRVKSIADKFSGKTDTEEPSLFEKLANVFKSKQDAEQQSTAQVTPNDTAKTAESYRLATGSTRSPDAVPAPTDTRYHINPTSQGDDPQPGDYDYDPNKADELAQKRLKLRKLKMPDGSYKSPDEME